MRSVAILQDMAAIRLSRIDLLAHSHRTTQNKFLAYLGQLKAHRLPQGIAYSATTTPQAPHARREAARRQGVAEVGEHGRCSDSTALTNRGRDTRGYGKKSTRARFRYFRSDLTGSARVCLPNGEVVGIDGSIAVEVA
jgi:hypothetical protein